MAMMTRAMTELVGRFPARAQRCRVRSAMVCCHPYGLAEGHEHAFAVDPTAITFGSGVLDEAGDWCRALEIRRALLMTDERVGKLSHVARVRESLARAGVDVAVYDRVQV